MFRLTLLLFTVIGASLAGTFFVAALTAGLTTTQPIVIAALAGFALGLPASWYVAQQIG